MWVGETILFQRVGSRISRLVWEGAMGIHLFYSYFLHLPMFFFSYFFSSISYFNTLNLFTLMLTCFCNTRHYLLTHVTLFWTGG